MASERQPTEQELLDALRQLRVADVLVQSLSTVASLAFHRLDDAGSTGGEAAGARPETGAPAAARESRELEQARLAIEALRALVPVLRGSVPDELVRDFESVTANLQLAYAAAVANREPAEAPPEGGDPEDGQVGGRPPGAE